MIITTNRLRKKSRTRFTKAMKFSALKLPFLEIPQSENLPYVSGSAKKTLFLFMSLRLRNSKKKISHCRFETTVTLDPYVVEVRLTDTAG